MTVSLVEKYRLGIISDDHLVVESLHSVDPRDPGHVLSSLPSNILLKILQFAHEFRTGRMVTNYGLTPAQDQVLAAQKWIESLLQETAGKTA